MFPSTHFIFSLIPITLIYPIYSLSSFLFLIGSFLIDSDHYLWYLIRYKSLSIKGAYKESTEKHKDRLHVFHTIEFLLLTGFLSFYSTFIFIIFLGLVFHMLLDLPYMLYKDCFGCRAFSFFRWLKRHLPSKSNR